MRRFFRFTLRDLLWLTLVVAIGLGWYVRERQHRTNEEQYRETIANARAANRIMSDLRKQAGSAAAEMQSLIEEEGYRIWWIEQFPASLEKVPVDPAEAAEQPPAQSN